VPTPVGTRKRLTNDLGHAPLVPIALAATLGIVLDRYVGLPLVGSLSVALLALLGWVLARRRRQVALSPLLLWVSIASLAAAYHHVRRDVYPADDIGSQATDEDRLVRARGVIVEEPFIRRPAPLLALRSIRLAEPTLCVIQVTDLYGGGAWTPTSGRAQLIIDGRPDDLHVGDEVELVGRLRRPHGPANPGEADSAERLRDRRIRAQIEVHGTPDAVVRLGTSRSWWPSVWLARLRGWGERTLVRALPNEQGGMAVALLLGDGSGMTEEDWDAYKRTGVIHALAISGYHLVILAAFLTFLSRFLPIRRRYAIAGVTIFLLAYALLAGGRPPILRAAVMVCAATGALLLRRPTMPANVFALAWLVVGVINPSDWFEAGCLLSFLAVALLYFGLRRWFGARADPTAVAGLGRWLFPSTDPLQALVEESRPAWQRALLGIGRRVVLSYAVSVVIWCVAAPLVAARYHVVAPIGILIGPPAFFLTAIGLLSGFLLLLTAPIGGPFTTIFAAGTRWSLGASAWLVRAADVVPGGHWYVGDVPEWWLWALYLILFAVLLIEPVRQRWRWALPAGAAWLCVGLLAGSARPADAEMRCAFLAVGHGGCSVIETPDGRVLLYDAGAMGGPDVTRRQIAPYLWSRGIHRIDEVFLSHADLDHFNGLPALLDRFSVGQVTCTPSFGDKNTPGVRETLLALERHGVPVRIARAGDRFDAGDVRMEVLHPPESGPEGNENARSMVLRLTHAGHTLILTGDLEGPGLQRVLALPPEPVDVLMAPHHGSKRSNTPDLASWARPRVVIACQGPPRSPGSPGEPYTAEGGVYLGTWPHGAITVHSTQHRLFIETFRTKEHVNISPPSR
jgi:competence protein ComEC